MTFKMAATAALLMFGSGAIAQPVVKGNSVSWPGDGWHQVQSFDGNGRLDDRDFCQGVNICDRPVTPGKYVLINLDADPSVETARWKFEVFDTAVDATIDATIDTDNRPGVRVEGNIIKWPNKNEWHVVQRVQDGQPNRIECEGFTSVNCPTLSQGEYIVINVDADKKYPGIMVFSNPGDAYAGGVRVEGNTVKWPSGNGWYIVQNSDTYEVVCQSGDICTPENGNYKVVNIRTKFKTRDVVVPGSTPGATPVVEEPVEESSGGGGPVVTGGDLVLDRSLYRENGYNDSGFITVELQTFPYNNNRETCTADTPEEERGCTLDDVIADIRKDDDLTVDLPIAIKTSDGFEYNLGDGPNAMLRQRGGGSRGSTVGETQSSFRIKLDSKKEDDLWRGERFLQLNKHPFDNDRMRNKLAMDLMSRVPHLPSFRTQFVNLFIDGEDFGLFTHVERINDDYLKRRDLDGKGNLYKARNFTFDAKNLAQIAVDENGKPLDKNRFEDSLDIEEGKDHTALVNMLTSLHAGELSFEQVLDKHFNMNNVMAWVSTNLLLNQWDATKQNFILYNPSGTEVFYFLPWDYDATMAQWQLPANNSLRNSDLQLRIRYGYGLGGENYFLEQFLKLDGMHQKLVEAISSLRENYLDDNSISTLSNQHYNVVKQFRGPTAKGPDKADANRYFPPSFTNNIRVNESTINNDFSLPVPPTLLEPRVEGSSVIFAWEPAIDITGNEVTYDIQVATSRLFEFDSIVSQTSRLDSSQRQWYTNAASFTVGQSYYVRLIARSTREPGRFWVPASNVDLDSTYTPWYGVRRFILR